MKRFIEDYLAIAVMSGLVGSAAWLLFTAYATPEGEQGAVTVAMGIIICFVAPFMLVIFVSGLLAGREQLGDANLEYNLIQHADQRQRLGFVLMSGSLPALAAMAVVAEPAVVLAVGSTTLLIGGCVLVISSIR